MFPSPRVPSRHVLFCPPPLGVGDRTGHNRVTQWYRTGTGKGQNGTRKGQGIAEAEAPEGRVNLHGSRGIDRRQPFLRISGNNAWGYLNEVQ